MVIRVVPTGVSCGVVVVELRSPPPPSSLLLLLTSSPTFAAVDNADLAIMLRILSLICPRRLGGMVNFGWVLGLISISENWVVNSYKRERGGRSTKISIFFLISAVGCPTAHLSRCK